jgi:ComF family protein
MLKSITTFLNACLDLVYPPQCLLCHKKVPHHPEILCDICRHNITFNTPPFCKKCSRHLTQPTKKNLCPQCHKKIPDFDRSWGVVLYTKPMKDLLHLFKYQKKTALRHVFADLMISFIKQHHIPLTNFDCLIPIPIHSVKHREREFNQTELLCHLIGKEFAIPVNASSLVRMKNTRPQAFLDEKERWTNVQGAFKIRKPLELKNKSILLVDDLMTTGATACEAAKMCRKAGAIKVSILTLAIGQ